MQGFSNTPKPTFQADLANTLLDMGRYVPPDQEGVQSANKLAGKHALGARANKIKQGILTVRFEMPFPIWCTTCPKPAIIGQGVRFNAEKKKVGNYYSTAIYSFRMKHVACGGWIEIRTDPKNTAYVVTEGAKKRDLGEDRLQEGEIRIGATEEDRKRLEEDAFAALEAKKDDAKQAASDKSRIEELYRAKERDWDDPGAANRRIRRGFRVEKRIREKRKAAAEALKDRMSLGMDLLDEIEEDKRRASFIEFGELDGASRVSKVQSRPLFAGSRVEAIPLRQKASKGKDISDAEQRRQKLQREVGNNTRVAMDPFLGNNKFTSTKGLIIKRKQPPTPPPDGLDNSAKQACPIVMPLVDYDSD